MLLCATVVQDQGQHPLLRRRLSPSPAATPMHQCTHLTSRALFFPLYLFCNLPTRNPSSDFLFRFYIKTAEPCWRQTTEVLGCHTAPKSCVSSTKKSEIAITTLSPTATILDLCHFSPVPLSFLLQFQYVALSPTSTRKLKFTRSEFL